MIIRLVTSRFVERRPDFLLLMELEEDCLKWSEWRGHSGPMLFRPTKISTRFYTLLHGIVRRLGIRSKATDAVVSLGLPYRHYLFGKTFPHLALRGGLRVLWTYDVWEPRFEEIAAIVREARIDLLLLSSAQATKHFRGLDIPGCEVHWVPEAIELARYQPRPWDERRVDVVSFGRGYARYHQAIVDGCSNLKINYQFQPNYPDPESFVRGLCDARISICFPRSDTHPQDTGEISTVTLRYLQSMAAKCLIVGRAPADAQEMFGYNPVVEVDWHNPTQQLEQILHGPEAYLALVERNFAAVSAHHQTRNFVASVDRLIENRISGKSRRGAVE